MPEMQESQSGSNNSSVSSEDSMTFEEFLNYVREHIGYYCTDKYWLYKYNILSNLSREKIIKQMPYLAVNAIGTDHASKNRKA